MRKQLQRVTIRDVAQLAGVSAASVSKVLNNAGGVSQETRKNVNNAMETLKYRPNNAARSLRAQRSHTIGLITDDIEGVFTTSLVRGVEEACTVEGFNVFLCNSYGETERERNHLEALLAKQIDGVILLSGYKVSERKGPAFPLGNLPMVFLYQYTHEMAVPCVIPDDEGGAQMGTRYLIEQGHRRIGFINGPAHYEATHLRLKGYRQALEAAGIAFDPALVKGEDWYQESGYHLTKELLNTPNPPTAIFCVSDILAIGAADAIYEQGLRIPQDAALLGFDNRFFAAHQRPPLSTVALPLYEMGKMAGELLLQEIRGAATAPEIHRVPCTLIERASTQLTGLPSDGNLS